MALQAYILIQTDVGAAADVAKVLRDLPGVLSAEDVTGPYDVILKVESDDPDSLGHFMVEQVQRVDGITRTLTCQIVNL